MRCSAPIRADAVRLWYGVRCRCVGEAAGRTVAGGLAAGMAECAKVTKPADQCSRMQEYLVKKATLKALGSVSLAKQAAPRLALKAMWLQ